MLHKVSFGRTNRKNKILLTVLSQSNECDKGVMQYVNCVIHCLCQLYLPSHPCLHQTTPNSGSATGSKIRLKLPGVVSFNLLLFSVCFLAAPALTRGSIHRCSRQIWTKNSGPCSWFKECSKKKNYLPSCFLQAGKVGQSLKTLAQKTTINTTVLEKGQ